MKNNSDSVARQHISVNSVTTGYPWTGVIRTCIRCAARTTLSISQTIIFSSQQNELLPSILVYTKSIVLTDFYVIKYQKYSKRGNLWIHYDNYLHLMVC